MATKKAIPKKKAVTKKPAISKAEKEEEKRRADWEINNELISHEFFESIIKNKKFPTYQSIADKLGLDVKTVKRHLQGDDMFEDIKTKMKALKNKALLTLAIRAIEGKNHHFMRLFFEVTDEVKKKDEDKTITININGKPINAGS